MGSATAAQADKVLLFGPSVNGGAASFEAQQAAAEGFGVDVVNATTWSSMTTAQFAAYRAIVIGDNDDSSTTADLAAAESNASVWGAAVRGRVILTGADPEFHAGDGVPGAFTFINKGIAFAASSPSETGAYIALPGYYDNGPNTPAKVLDAFSPGGFTATHQNQNNIHIDPAITPGPSGLSDGDLIGWGQTAHSYFTFPSNFRVWAIGVVPLGPYLTSDGQKGVPSFIVRDSLPGVTSISPGSGPITGGTALTISGQGFSAGTSVSFGGVPAAAVTVNSDSQITAVSPPGAAPGPVDVSAANTAGKSAAADKFTYTACVVPKLKGKKLKRAKKKLRNGDCKLGKVNGSKGGKVKKQRPKAGTFLAPHSKVKVKLG